MKRCPDCGRDYNDDSLSYCLDDGSELLFGPALELAKKAGELNPDAAPPMYVMGVLYTKVGDKDRAFEYLERSFEQREPDILRLQDENLDPIRNDPRFQDLVRRIGMPVSK